MRSCSVGFSAVVEFAKPACVDVEGGDERTLRAEELAGDVESLAADNGDLLTAEELLGDNAGQTTEQMALAINDDL